MANPLHGYAYAVDDRFVDGDVARFGTFGRVGAQEGLVPIQTQPRRSLYVARVVEYILAGETGENEMQIFPSFRARIREKCVEVSKVLTHGVFDSNDT